MSGFRVEHNGCLDDLLIRIAPWTGSMMSVE